MTPEPLPIACTLSAEALKARRGDLTSILRTAASVDETQHGLRWQFDSRPGLVAELAALIDAERVCCQFLAFVLRADARGGSVTLEVTGPPGTRDFLQTWLSAQP